MFKIILAILFIALLICVFWFPKQTTKTVHTFWQSNFVRSSIIYAEDNNVPITKIVPKTEQRKELFHRR